MQAAVAQTKPPRPTHNKQGLPMLVLNPYGVARKYEDRFSVSQIDTWRLCQRKWGFRALDKIEAHNKYAERGLKVHAHAEDYLIYGRKPPMFDRYGRLVDKGLEHLPKPGTCEVEREFEYISRNGIRYVGFLDILTIMMELGGVPAVMDHKSTTSLRWAHTEQTLIFNTQACLYGLVAAARFEVDEVYLRWIYYEDHASKPRSKPVVAMLSRAHAESVVDQMDATADEIAACGRTKKTAAELPGNARACDAYGGCPYRDRCGLSDEDKLGALMEQQSIRDRLQSGIRPAQAPTTTGNQAAGISVLEQMRQRALGAAPATTTPAAAAPAQTPAAAAAPAQTQVSAPATTTPTGAAAQPAGAGVLARLQQRVAAAPAASGTVDSVANAGMAAAQAELERQEQGALAPATQHAPTDINPPETPENPVDDPDQLAMSANSKVADAPTADGVEKKKRVSRSASIATAPAPTKVLTDEGYLYTHVYVELIRLGGTAQDAADFASSAVVAFRTLA